MISHGGQRPSAHSKLEGSTEGTFEGDGGRRLQGENYSINQGRVNQWNKLLIYSSFQYRCTLLFCFFIREWKMLAGTWDPAQEFSMHGLRL